VRLSCLGKRESLRDEWLDLLLLKEVEQGDQVLSKQCRPQPFERLDAVGDDSLPAREKPAADDVQREGGGSTKALTATGTARSQSLPAYRGNEAVAHDSPARTERLARMPQVGAADRIHDDVYAIACEAANLLHEVLAPVINWDTAQGGDRRCPSR
jgi:hypothetical protein